MAVVYRGCADEKLLPMGVSTDLHCRYRGPTESMWWFCEGDLCNGGPVDENLHCQSAPEPTIYDESPPENEATGNDVTMDEVKGATQGGRDQGVQINVKIEEDVDLPGINAISDIAGDPERRGIIAGTNAPEGKEGYEGKEEFTPTIEHNEVKIDVKNFKEGVGDGYYDLAEKRSHLLSGRSACSD